MGLTLKVAPKNLYWVAACILCPQDGDDVEESHFEVQFERFKHADILQFQREQAAALNHSAVALVRSMKKRTSEDAKAADAMEAAYEAALAELPEDFDAGSDFALRWLQKKVRAFRGLETADDQAVTVEDLPELIEYPSYRIGLMNLLRKQMEDPNAAERKN